MKLVEIEKSQSLIQFGDSRENGQPSGLIAKERNQEPNSVGDRCIEVSQALMYAFRCPVNGHRWSRMVFGFNFPASSVSTLRWLSSAITTRSSDASMIEATCPLSWSLSMRSQQPTVIL